MKALIYIDNNKGFTIIEVLMAIIILTIGLLGLAPLMVTSMAGNEFANDMTEANLIATDQIENLKTIPNFSPTPFLETVTGIQNRFTRQTRVDDSNSDSNVPENLYYINVVVSWVDKNGIARSVNYNTFSTKGS